MYDTTKPELLEMFLDRTADETEANNRLTTEETDNGDVALIAYGWIQLAVYSESREAVTVFTGHKAINSRTVNTYLNDVVNAADKRGRAVILSGESPTVDTPNPGVKYINNYISFGPNVSPVERDAHREVMEQLKP